MTCTKPFSLTVDSGICCLELLTSIAGPTDPAFVGYDSTNDRIVSDSRGTLDFFVINPVTNAVIGSANSGVITDSFAFAPVTGRFYIRGQTAPNDYEVFNAATIAFEASIAEPATLLSGTGQIVYDTTNQVLYHTGLLTTAGFEDCLVRIDPVGASASILISNPVPPVGDSDRFGRFVAHNPVNNRIYIPYGYSTGGGPSVVSLNMYSAAGAFIGSIALPTSTDFSTDDGVFYSASNQLLYYTGVYIASGNPGVAVINPATASVVAVIDFGTVRPGMVDFSIPCGSACITDWDANLNQYRLSNHTLICSKSLAAPLGTIVQSAIATGNNRFYFPDSPNNLIRVAAAP